MGEHGNKDSNERHEGRDIGYQPRHSGGRDGFEWANEEVAKDNQAAKDLGLERGKHQ